MERRFEKEDENMTQMPEQEEAIFVKLGDENLSLIHIFYQDCQNRSIVTAVA